jgi:methyl-accepting chemotaxis protein
MAGAVGVAVYLIVALADDSTRLSERPFEYATAIHDAALDAKGIANNERGFLISGDTSFVDDLEEGAADARAAFAAAQANASTSRERQAAAEAKAGFDRWLQAVRREIAAYQAGSRADAVAASLGPTRDLRKSYERSLASAHALGLDSIETATRSVSSSASRSVTILLVYLAAALLLGVAVTLWVARTILRPTSELTRHALDVLTNSRILVEEDTRGSHRGVTVEVPLEVVNTLAASALETREVLGAGEQPAG